MRSLSRVRCRQYRRYRPYVSVNRVCLGHLEWQQEPSTSICHESGRSSEMSIYSFARIFLISFGGTEPKPGIIDRSSGRGQATPDTGMPVDVVTTVGHRGSEAGALPDAKSGHSRVLLIVAPLRAVARENIGRTPARERGEGTHKL